MVGAEQAVVVRAAKEISHPLARWITLLDLSPPCISLSAVYREHILCGSSVKSRHCQPASQPASQSVSQPTGVESVSQPAGPSGDHLEENNPYVRGTRTTRSYNGEAR